SLVDVIDGSIPEAIGSLAAERATGDELAALYKELQSRIDEAIRKGNSHGTLTFLQNLSNRAGFDSLVERIMIAQKDGATQFSDKNIYHSQIRALVNYYSERGDYRRVLELVETESKRNPTWNK